MASIAVSKVFRKLPLARARDAFILFSALIMVLSSSILAFVMSARAPRCLDSCACKSAIAFLSASTSLNNVGVVLSHMGAHYAKQSVTI